MVWGGGGGGGAGVCFDKPSTPQPHSRLQPHSQPAGDRWHRAAVGGGQRIKGGRSANERQEEREEKDTGRESRKRTNSSGGTAA